MDRAVLDKYITDTYGAVAEYMWEKYPTFERYQPGNAVSGNEEAADDSAEGNVATEKAVRIIYANCFI